MDRAGEVNVVMSTEEGVEARLAPGLESVVVARMLVTEAARRWQLPDAMIENATLVVSELVTNAVLHVGAPLIVAARRSGAGLRIEVQDESPRLPIMVSTCPEELVETASMTGRGLAVVEASSDRWGAELKGTGKVVWAEVLTDQRIPCASANPASPGGGLPARRASLRISQTRVPVSAPPTGGGRAVHLMGMPARLLLEASRQLSDLQRELQVIELGHSGPAELQALAEAISEIEARLGYLRELGLEVAEQAVAQGDATVDLDIVVPLDIPEYLDRLGALLARMRDTHIQRYLLTLPAGPEVVAYRVWWQEEVLAQLAGRQPRPCPFPA